MAATTLSLNRTLGGGGKSSEVGSGILALPACTAAAFLGIMGFKGITHAMLEAPDDDDAVRREFDSPPALNHLGLGLGLGLWLGLGLRLGLGLGIG